MFLFGNSSHRDGLLGFDDIFSFQIAFSNKEADKMVQLYFLHPS